LPNDFNRPWTERQTNEFKAHYGSSPVVLLNQWFNLMTTKLDVGLTGEAVTEKG
jgi:hypothetical protein